MPDRPAGPAPRVQPPDRGRYALALLGGGVLVLAVAGGAWAAFGRDAARQTTDASSRPAVTTTSTGAPIGSAAPVAGPAVPTGVRPTVARPAPARPAARPAAAPAPPARTAPAPAAPAAGPPAKDVPLAVTAGDTLWGLTRKALTMTGRPATDAAVASYVTRFYARNTGRVGPDPDVLRPGQVLVWPRGL